MPRWTPWRAGGIAAILAVTANLIVSTILRSTLDIDPEFLVIQASPVVFLTVVGAVLATAVYGSIAASSPTPMRSFTRLAVVVLPVTWLADVGLLLAGESAGVPGVTPTAVGALASLHAVAAVVIVATLLRLAPVPDRA